MKPPTRKLPTPTHTADGRPLQWIHGIKEQTYHPKWASMGGLGSLLHRLGFVLDQGFFDILAPCGWARFYNLNRADSLYYPNSASGPATAPRSFARGACGVQLSWRHGEPTFTLKVWRNAVNPPAAMLDWQTPAPDRGHA